MTNSWTKLTDVYGRINADSLQVFLTANTIHVQLVQEGVGHYIYPATFGELAKVEVLVPSDQIEEARALLEAYNTSVPVDENESIDDEELSEE
jgi:hypothetical protein